ncbi:MAG TPA: M20/M25/M40 family metallo-hydrolase [Gemmatimonadaceae bacterium]
MRPASRIPHGIAVLLALTCAAGALRAQGAGAAARERQLIGIPSADSARRHAQVLSREAHVAGTPAQRRTAEYVVAQMRRWGLETETRSYEVWMPHATAVRVTRLSPAPLELPLREPAVPGDASSSGWQYPTVNGSSGAGDVTAEIVYVNYGLIEDYAQLDSLGVSVKGRIAVARYGRSFRGIKAREAEKRGARALIMYSDPADDGYARGDVYPEGPMRNARGVQRGSVYNGDGDPTTPGWASTPGARRLPLDSTEVPRIPVVPVSYGNAAELLRGLRGAAIPAGWQGGLPFRYHAGPGPVRARVRVEDDRATQAFKRIHDTFGVIRGTDFPDELVIIGAHRDAWGPGAADNVSGTVSVLEAARALSALVKQGWRPRRTILLATWDAEEWGLVGSTEFVEEDSLRLARGAVAYLNQDVAASGARFGGGGSPSLRALLRDVTRAVPSPAGGSVYAAWRRDAAVPDSAEPAMGDPGGGSDFAGFYNHLGIPIAEWGFGGPGGVYHSHYDSFDWMRRFGDTSFAYHATAARIAAAMILRLADADVLPYDYVEFARAVRRYLPGLTRQASQKGWTASLEPLASAIDQMEREAAAFAAARDSAAREAPLARDASLRVNGALLGVERALTRPEGLRTRPWFRGLIYAADEDNGYATMVLPSIGEAIRGGDERVARAEIADLAARFGAAAAKIAEARAALR